MPGRERPVGLGVCGLGRAFVLMLPTFRADPRVRLVAATSPGADSRARFAAAFDAPAYATLDDLCADPEVEAVYVASPHECHAEQVATAARAGKHVLVEKPLAVSMADGEAMVAAAASAGIHLVVGPSHSFDPPVLLARRLIESGRFGRVRMIQALTATDFLYRPRRPEELDTARGGGVVFSQAVHQIDVVRLLAGGRARSVRAHAGAWDPARPTEGAYAMLVDFEDGAFASLTYSGYAHFDTAELQGGIGELGHAVAADAYGRARRAVAGLDAGAEAALKRGRTFAAVDAPPPPSAHEHFGFLLACCDRGDLRPRPDGVTVYGDATIRHEALEPPTIPRRPVIDALWDAVVHDRPPLQSGAWGLASLEVCHALLRSAAERRDVPLRLQVPAPPLP